MIYITQLVHIREGRQHVFNEFEEMIQPLITRHNGTLVLRLRPDVTTVVSSSIDIPYEVHIVKFDSDRSFENFMYDEERKNFLQLKERSIRSIIIIKGQIVSPVANRLSIL